jgi:YD repeat-containing protein
MVGVVTGVGLGLERSSSNTLGANALLGDPTIGEGPDEVTVNAANGNLIDTRTDQILTGIGLDDVISETYNSLGQYGTTLGTYANGPWMADYQQVVGGLTGTLGASGSTITHIAADGSNVIYSFTSSSGGIYTYTGYEGPGPADTLKYNTSNSTWTLTDATTQDTETFTSAGRLSGAADPNGNKLTYNYSGSTLSSIYTTDNTGSQDYTSFNYNSSGQISSISTSYWNIQATAQQTLTQEYYTYDSLGRLSTITIDQSPQDNSISDGNTFVTTYGYSGSTALITSITGSDGSSLAIGYNGSSQVTSVTQTVASGVTRATTFNYGTGGAGSGLTTITDPLSIQTQLSYVTSGSTQDDLTEVAADTSDPGSIDTNQITLFGSWTNFNVGTVTTGGATVTYGYNTAGDRNSMTDGAGNVTNWTYGSLNQLLATTLNPASGTTETSYDVYDTNLNLRFTVTQQGLVTQYVYGGAPGEATSVIQYTNDAFNTSGYSASSPPSLSTMTSWVSGLSDLQNTERTDTTYDMRGNVWTVETYGADTSGGLGASSTTENSLTNFVYSPAGQLLNDTPAVASTTYSYGGTPRLPTDPSGANVAYDGFGQILTSTNLRSATTISAYDLNTSITAAGISTLDASYTINAAGAVTLDVYDKAGELVSTTAFATELTSSQVSALGSTFNTFAAVSTDVGTPGTGDATTTYKYDADGRLMMVTDPDGANSYYLYDTLGRKTADIAADGEVTEYGYNAANQVDETIQYANRLSSSVLTSTLAAASITSPVTIASVRPSTSSSDRYTWSVYDSAYRLIESIDGTGAVTTYAYDGASNLLSTTEYANLLTSSQLTTFKSTPPTSATLPTADPGVDRVMRNFYDGDNRLIGTLNADGYLTETLYDDADQKTRDIAFATQASSSLWASGTFAALLSNVAPSGPSSSDENTWYVYDSRGLLRGVVDADGDVTQYHYDPLGQVDQTITGQQLSVSTLLSTPPTLSTLTGLATSGATVNVTNNTLYLTGETLTSTNTAASTVTNTYDVLGEVVATTDADNNVTRYVYDAFGRQIYAIDALGDVTQTTYDNDGHAVTVRSYANPVASGTLSSWGLAVTASQVSAAVSATSGDEVTNNVYNPDGQLAYSLNAALTLTEYDYDASGNLTQEIQYAGAVTATSSYTVSYIQGQITSLGLASLAGNRTTTHAFDADDRLTSETDATSAGQSFAYDAFGDTVSDTNQLGGTTTYVYNGVGEMTSQTLPITSTTSSGTVEATSVTDHYAYDAFGNSTQLVEAYGLTEQRTTNYTYDADNNLLTTVVDPGTGQLNLTTANTYDANGALIEQVDPDGNKTFFYYDTSGRKIGEVNAVGALVEWTYDANGNVATQTAFASLLTSLPSSPGGSPPSAVNPGTYRETSYQYDADNRLTKTTIDQITGTGDGFTTGSANSSGVYSYSTPSTGISTQTYYDAFGNVWKNVDANGAATYNFYNALGQKIATVDPAGSLAAPTGALTTYAYDVFGDVTAQTQYATELAAGYASSYSAATDQTAPTQSSNANDRITDFTYDKDGRRLTESRLNDAYSTVSSSGTWGGSTATTTVTGTATIAYKYNGLGQVLTQTQATGDATTYTYDSEGRLATTTDASYLDQNAFSVSPETTDAYDGLGDLTVSTQVGADGLSNRNTYYTYGQAGRLTSMADADNNTQNYTYDADGNLLQVSYQRVNSAGTQISEEVKYAYNALGNQTSQATADYISGSWVSGDSTNTEYDAFGEVTGKGLNGLYQQTYAYDGAGRMIESDAGNGSTSFFVYDGDGNQTLEIDSAGSTNLASGNLSAALADATPSGGTVGSGYVSGVNPTISEYDARGELTTNLQTYRQINGTDQTISQSSTYDAFGDVISSTNALGGTSYFTFNTLGDQTSDQAPAVGYTDQSGTAHAGATPTSYAFFDLGGREVGTQDANGNPVTKLYLLAGTGYSGSQALTAEQFNPDTGDTITNGYDVFGDLRTITNGLSQTETRTYDGMNRLLTDSFAAVSGSTLTDDYAYDQLGQRIKSWNSVLGSSVVSTTDYDSQGRVSKQVDYDGYATTYSYAWSGSIATSGLGTFGGWTETTNNPAGQSETQQFDFFGRLVGQTDFGTHVYGFTFDDAGRLLTQTTTTPLLQQATPYDEDLVYTYFDTGKTATITDYIGSASISGGATYYYGYTTTYAYDANADITTEDYSYFYPTTTSCGIPNGQAATAYETETATYDLEGRVTGASDSGYAGGQAMSVSYLYDANGNVRYIGATYESTGGNGTGSATSGNTESYWYAYDWMNREVVAEGVLVSGVIERNDLQGESIAYDAAGERKSATTSSEVIIGSSPYDDIHTEYYTYNADGYLLTTNTADQDVTYGTGGTGIASGTQVNIAAYTYDLLGRVTQLVTTDHDASASTPTRTVNSVYDDDGNVTSDTNYYAANDVSSYTQETHDTYAYASGGDYLGGMLVSQTTTGWWDNKYGYNTSNPTSTSNTYGWTTAAHETGISYDPNTGGSTIYTTALDYSADGYLTSAAITDGASHTITYVNNAAGEVVYRTDSAGPTLENYYLDNHQIGSTDNSGPTQTDYATAINSQYGTAPSPTQAANFDQNYTPVSPTNPANAASSYTVQAGDTLASIAQNTWGDASLWYLIADANGLTSSSSLIAGTTLTIPNKVVSIGHTSSTFKPYNSTQQTGYILPTAGPKANASSGCGVVGEILAVIVAVVVTVATEGAFLAAAGVQNLTLASLLSGSALAGAGASVGGLAGIVGIGAVAGAAGDIASQGIEIAVGNQSSFNWSGVALGALGGALSAGLDATGPLSLAKAGNGILAGVERAALSSTITQGIGVATGLQQSFDWGGVAASATEALAGEGLAKSFGPNATSLPNEILESGAALLAGAATRSVVSGTDFEQSLAEEAPNVIGQNIGAALIQSNLLAPPVNSSVPAFRNPNYMHLAGNDAEASDVTPPPAVSELVVHPPSTNIWAGFGGDGSHVTPEFLQEQQAFAENRRQSDPLVQAGRVIANTYHGLHQVYNDVVDYQLQGDEMRMQQDQATVQAVTHWASQTAVNVPIIAEIGTGADQYTGGMGSALAMTSDPADINVTRPVSNLEALSDEVTVGSIVAPAIKLVAAGDAVLDVTAVGGRLTAEAAGATGAVPAVTESLAPAADEVLGSNPSAGVTVLGPKGKYVELAQSMDANYLDTPNWSPPLQAQFINQAADRGDTIVLAVDLAKVRAGSETAVEINQLISQRAYVAVNSRVLIPTEGW